MFISLSPASVARLLVLAFQPFQSAPWLHALSPAHPSTTYQAEEATGQSAHMRQSIPLCLPKSTYEQEPHPQVEEEYSSHY